MTRLTIRHETRYTYANPVSFLPHRLLLRPRDSHAIRLVSASLELSPPGSTRWVYDALGNCVCLYQPDYASDHLTIISNLTIETFPSPMAHLPVANPHTASPIVYSSIDHAVLESFIRPATDDRDVVLMNWIRDHTGQVDEPVLDFLLRLTRSIHGEFTYNERYEEGVQSPSRTIQLKSGSCRDFAWLMIESLRRLGYAARYIMGYVHSPATDVPRAEGGMVGGGATHAWCEVFLPDLGWMEFDPTNGLAESPDLIRVATVRTPAEAAPVAGEIVGAAGACKLFVHVRVTTGARRTGAAA